MAGVQEENRLRIALLLLGLGGGLVLFGVLLGAEHYRSSHAPEQVPPAHAASAPAVHLTRQAEVGLIKQILFILVVLVSILAVSLYAFRLWSRRFRQMLLHKPAPPTPDGDVWAMHRLPEDALTEFTEPPPDAAPEEGP